MQNRKKTFGQHIQTNANDSERSQSRTNNNNNYDLDSGISSISNNSHVHLDDQNHFGPHSCSNSGDESVDSFETCGEDTEACLATSSDISEKLHFSDADETLPPVSQPDSVTAISTIKPRPNKSKSVSVTPANKIYNEKPEYSSIVSELFDGKLISQVQCLECNHFSTTTETFQHLSLPIPSKEYLQALHTKISHNKRGHSSSASYMDDEDDEAARDAQQGWLSWMADVIKGYIWSTTIKLTECLTAFFSDDDLKGDNMYSCEKCKK